MPKRFARREPKTCQCGKQFVPRCVTRKYCSPECSKAAQLAAQRARLASPMVPPEVTERACLGPGAPHTFRSEGPHHRFCGKCRSLTEARFRLMGRAGLEVVCDTRGG